MNQVQTTPARNRTGGLTFLALVNAAAFFITVIFWGAVFFMRLVPLPGDMETLTERANSAVTYGFFIGDIIYSAPLLALAWIGIWKLKSWGWMAAQMANALWIYSMTVILLRDAYAGFTPGGILFTPFMIISIWAIPYLWKHRKDFGVIE
jgi:hypothetical protein